MRRLNIGIVALVMSALLFGACNKDVRLYRKYSVKGTVAQRDSAAYFFYKREDWGKAAFLFEDLLGYYRASKRYADVLYHLAYSKFNQRSYIEAANYYEQFVKQYPNDERTEECAFQLALTYYQQSLPYYLDPGPTNVALNQFEFFNAAYPLSQRQKESNNYIEDLRERLSRKSFEQARLYHRIGDFKAAVKAFEVTIKKHPDSKYREEAEYLWFVATADLADKSTDRRKKLRYREAIARYEQFVDKYPSSDFLKDAEDRFAKAKRNLGEILADEAEEEDSSK